MKTRIRPARSGRIAAAVLAPLLMLCLIGNAVAGKIYRCVDDKKKVTVSDTPCTATAVVGDTDKSKPTASDTKDDKGGAPQPKKESKG